ncbi:MAG: CapA family protein [Deltaproteobacteria bacterium]|jgi:poly-gamma-glutamate synthesis protein (capsule biosynthesis protein)|nr:CapA family protein [Deltaproteobacteria bacterium]MBW2531857.1 CapA family protein [Deltaproteobacteria bacterium]
MRSALPIALAWGLALLGLAAGAGAEPAPAERLIVTLAGDVGYPNQFARGDVIDRRKHQLFEQVRPILDGAHLSFANLECAFTHRPPSVPTMWPLSCPPHRLDYPVDAGLDVFSLANNHMMDAAAGGVLDTIAGLEARARPTRRLWWTGAGATPEQARRPAIVRSEGADAAIAFFAVTNAHPAGGIASLFDSTLPRRIARAARQRDLVIVSVHYGTEHLHVPSADVTRRYRRLIDAGADVVVGHHPHVMQGVERRGEGVILYSLGDLSFGSLSERHHKQGGRLYSLIARLTVAHRQLEQVELIPTYHDNALRWTLGAETLDPIHGTPQLLAGAFAQAVLDELDRFSAAIGGAESTRLIRIGDRAFLDLGHPITNRTALLEQQRAEYRAVIDAGAGPRPATPAEMAAPAPPAELRSFPKPGSLRDLPPIH